MRLPAVSSNRNVIESFELSNVVNNPGSPDKSLLQNPLPLALKAVFANAPRLEPVARTITPLPKFIVALLPLMVQTPVCATGA